MDSQTVRDRCKSYLSTDKPTIKGLGVELQSSTPTLYRIQKEQYQTGKPYHEKRPSWNRRIDNNDFHVVTKSMQRIRDIRHGNGDYQSYL